ncbi:hypothetical protein CCACVL1_10383 [Corchorus capsularis]|uniref:Retrotransposon Copia-like N-terminal domain-containing protein n=1 Tax=Corchorus capsularis TaxID=210143 RepID=A0A1R3IRD0_COCAP|nr:hypothetical protein CCACVL1_10383 [Corchorus capsularis]
MRGNPQNHSCTTIVFRPTPAILSATLPAPNPSPSSLCFSLDGKELLQAAPDASLQSVGIVAGDLLYFSLNPNTFTTPPPPPPKRPPPYPEPDLNVPEFVIVRLNRTNYRLWRSQILALFKGEGLLGFLDETIPKPEPDEIPSDVIDADGEARFLVDNLVVMAWKASNKLVYDWIKNTISREAELAGVVIVGGKSTALWGAVEAFPTFVIQRLLVEESWDEALLSLCMRIEKFEEGVIHYKYFINLYNEKK